jgi:hypothetical protein
MPATLVKPEELINALFAKVYDTKPSFKFAHRDLHETFYELKNSQDFQPFFEDFLFRDNNVYPICDQIDEIFSEMQLTGTLSKLNPVLKVKKINYKDNEALNKLLGYLDEEEKATFIRLTESFITRIKARELDQ